MLAPLPSTSLIPISDVNPTKRFPVVTILLIAANIVMFFMTPDFGTDSIPAASYFYEHAPVPCQLTESCPDAVVLGTSAPIPIPERDPLSFIYAILFSTFLHAGFLHIAGNMLFLWVFGNNVEDFLGPIKYLLFYLAGGIVVGFAHVLTHLNSDPVPAVGASGAVAAAMGAYMVLFPRARVRTLVIVIFFITWVEVPALLVLGMWLVYQFVIGAQELAGVTGVAWMAHVGGFAFGALMIFILGGRPQQLRPAWPPDNYSKY